MTDAITEARIAALEARCAAAELRLAVLEQDRTEQEAILADDQTLRLELESRVADLEQGLHGAAPARARYRLPTGGPLRVEPRTSSPVLRALRPGDEVAGLGAVAGEPVDIRETTNAVWIRARTDDGLAGYVHSALVELV